MDRGVEGFVTSCVRVTLTGLFCPQYGQCYLRRYLPGRGVRMKFVFGLLVFPSLIFFLAISVGPLCPNSFFT